MDPAAFYQLGAQAGAQRMGGLPENLDKNRLMSMQLAPTLMAAQTGQQEAQMKGPYYQAMAGYYGNRLDPAQQVAAMQSREGIARMNTLAKLMTDQDTMKNLQGFGIQGTGPAKGGFLGTPWGAKPTFTQEDLMRLIQTLSLGGDLSGGGQDPQEAALMQQLQQQILAAQSQPTI
jgi:hypothetical protein